MKPVLAIVGRPNVGKSTLFNKIAGKRISIVEDTPGVTRDRIYADADWNGVSFSIIDTGGLEPSTQDEILRQMKQQAEIAIATSDVILFLTNIKDGLTADDIEIASFLKKSGKPLVLACNKSDTPGEPPLTLYDFYSLGLGEPLPISSIHGMGTGDLLDAVVALFPKTEGVEEEDDAVRVAVTGRPNAGKSSLINKILGENRVIVSPVSGTTRDAIDVRLTRGETDYIFIDTAGLRRKGKVEEGVERYSVIRTLAAVERCDVAVIMIDALEGITEQDTKIAGFAHEQGKASLIALNKWDALEKDTHTQKKFEKEIREKLAYMPYAPIICISAKTGQRVDKLFDLISYLLEQASLRVSTGALNDCINDATLRVQPPADKGKRLKIYYATQVSVRPPTFVFFVNDTELFHFSYQRYIENRIRETFGFSGTPVRLILREKSE